MAVLLIGIGVAVYFLYSGTENHKMQIPGASGTRSELLKAVPSDAAAVFCFSDVKTGKSILPSWVEISEDFIPSVVSLHFSGTFVPLLIAEGEDGEPFSLRSQSETLISSSERHFSQGLSILDDQEFDKLSSEVADKNIVYFSNEYASRLIPAWLGKQYTSYAPFVRTLSDWMAFSVREDSDKILSLQGSAVYGKSDVYFMNVLKGQGTGDSRITEVVPSTTTFALSIQISDLIKYEDAYQKFLDAAQRLSSFNKASLQWAEELGVREVGRAEWKSISGEDVNAVFIRQAKSSKESGTIEDNQYKSFATSLFGDIFKISDENFAAYVGDWVVYGSEVAVKDVIEAWNEQDHYDYSSPAVIVTYSRSRFNVDKVRAVSEARRKSAGAILGKVQIPQGPFEVKNSGTGKTNLFYQNENMYLCLKEKEGTGLWGVTFSEPICGSVETIDFYNNGKLQFLFAAGSKLYLIDRLGRFVSSFPVDTGKDILWGPAVYDFSGAKGYTAMVLHKDNTIEMYNLHGVKPAEWKGISSADTILGLPALVEEKGVKYWLVETARQKEVYDFWGGEPLKGKTIKNIVN